MAERDFDLTRSAWQARLLALAGKAEAAGDYSAARGCLLEIGQAMPQWYQPAVTDNQITVTNGHIQVEWGREIILVSSRLNAEKASGCIGVGGPSL